MSSNRRKGNTSTQFLGFVECAVCHECGKKVKWRVRSTYLCADGRHRVQYLRCPTPGCVGRATRMIDVPDGA